MSEPTIDELLTWLDVMSCDMRDPYVPTPEFEAIRAILEQYRDISDAGVISEAQWRALVARIKTDHS